DVVVVGAAEETAESLRTAVSETQKKLSTPWVKDRPTPFDEATAKDIRKKLKDAFAAQGFFAPSFDITIEAPKESQTAVLKVQVHQAGPRAEVGRIIVAGNERDSDSDLLHYLDLRLGQPFDSGLAERLKLRLEESGRFLRASVNRAGPAHNGNEQ